MTTGQANFGQGAKDIRDAACRHMVDSQTGMFVRALVREDGHFRPDTTLDASMAGVFLYGMLPPDDERVVRTMKLSRTSYYAALISAGSLATSRTGSTMSARIGKGSPAIRGSSARSGLRSG